MILTKWKKIIITTITHKSHQLEGEGVTTSRLLVLCFGEKTI